MVDLLLTPIVKPFNVTAYGKWHQLAQAGYEVALQPLSQWKEEWLASVLRCSS